MCTHFRPRPCVHTHRGLFNGSCALVVCFIPRTSFPGFAPTCHLQASFPGGGHCVLSAGSGYSHSRELPLWLQAGLNRPESGPCQPSRGVLIGDAECTQYGQIPGSCQDGDVQILCLPTPGWLSGVANRTPVPLGCPW